MTCTYVSPGGPGSALAAPRAPSVFASNELVSLRYTVYYKSFLCYLGTRLFASSVVTSPAPSRHESAASGERERGPRPRAAPGSR